MKNEVFYSETGKGNPVVFLHGYCETHRIWDEFSRKISKTHRVIALDLPGFGNSVLPGIEFSLADIAGQIHDLLISIRATACVVIGHSLGGYITLAYAKQYLSEIRGFGLFHSTAFEDSPEKKASRTQLIEFIGKNGVPEFIRTFIPSLFYNPDRTELTGYVEKLTEAALRTEAKSIQEYARAMRDREPHLDLLKNFQKPIMMIIGENDPSVPLEKSIEQSRHIQRPYVLTLKETGHMGMFERPSETLHFVQNFLNVCQ